MDFLFQLCVFLQIHHITLQFEVAAGLGGTVRLGFNPGEFIDFICGWFTIDIYGDDIETAKEKEFGERESDRSELKN